MLSIEEILRREACAFSQPTSAEEVLLKWKPWLKKIDGRVVGGEVMNQRTLKPRKGREFKTILVLSLEERRRFS